MTALRSRIGVTLAVFALLSACQQKPKRDATANPEPFWQAKPSIPYKPSNFCRTTKHLMAALPASTNFRCQGDLKGGLGARIDVSNVQIVLLQGAKSEWFMFAYELKEGARSAVSDQILERLQGEIEQALQPPEHD